MKAQVKSNGIAYPCLMRHFITGKVILFTDNRGTGTVVCPGEYPGEWAGQAGGADGTIGEHSIGWNMSDYNPMAPGEEVILTA